MVSVSDVLKAISDDKSLVLFNTIALATEDSGSMIKILKLSKKQYYSRINEMTDAGVIKRFKGKYFLTSFGKVIYQAQELIGKATLQISKLKAIDLLDTPDFPGSEYSKVVDSLIQNEQIKEIVRRRRYSDGARSEQDSISATIPLPLFTK
jgi:DNA-binding Lrp family transcriptional regulator